MILGFFKWTLFIYIYISFSFFYYHYYHAVCNMMIINKIRRGNKPFFITTCYHYYHALDKQGRVRRLCPKVPKALGTFNRDSRLKVLMYMVTFAHVHGHVCSL